MVLLPVARLLRAGQTGKKSERNHGPNVKSNETCFLLLGFELSGESA